METKIVVFLLADDFPIAIASLEDEATVKLSSYYPAKLPETIAVETAAGVATARSLPFGDVAIAAPGRQYVMLSEHVTLQ